MKRITFLPGLCSFIMCLFLVTAAGAVPVKFVAKENQIDVLAGGKLFTVYRYGKSLTKPVLHPVLSPSGETLTRGFPLVDLPGESHDHAHHIGMYFTVDEVNGNNFWGTKTAPPHIEHIKVLQMKGGDNRGVLTVLLQWIGKGDTRLLQEKRTMVFTASPHEYTIDFDITLTALDEKVVFKDTKEGMFAIRVAPWLREAGPLATAEYLSSNGDRKERGVWATRACWVRLQGSKDGKTIGIAILNHPGSINYPTYWHARGYGLFSANPLGQGVFQKSRRVKNPKDFRLTLLRGQSAPFKFRMLFYEGDKGKSEIDKEFKNYTRSSGKQVVAAGAKVKLLADGFKFTEGPAVDAFGNVYFTDQPNNRIMKWSIDGKLSTFLDNCERANGLYFDSGGNLIACADLHNRLVSFNSKGKMTVLVDKFKGKLLNGPNDLWINPVNGGIYFTDPFYKRPYWNRGPKEQDGECVYYLTPDGRDVIRVVDDLVQPNGLIGTPDGKRLYVADIRAGKTYAYTINADGTLGNKRLFCEMGSDGMTIDNEGNIYLTGKGVSVFDVAGNHIAQIPINESWTANVCFGGRDNHTLFITASDSLYAVRMRTSGVQPIMGELSSLVKPGAAVKKLCDGFAFTEGPAKDCRGNVFFSDIPNNRILKWNSREGLTTFLADSGGCNGLFFDKNGVLYACAGGDRQLVSITPAGKVKVLARSYKGKRLNSPNDLWLDPRGGIYFSDPRYGRRDGMEMDRECVYYLSPDGKTLKRVIDDMVRPNGLVGTPDGKRLYVTDNGGGKTYVYVINPDGSLVHKKLFAPEGADGMTLDQFGNVYLCTSVVVVYDPAGNKLEEIPVPERPANVCFGGPDNQTLYITARHSLYAVPMQVKGVCWTDYGRAYPLAYIQDFNNRKFWRSFTFTNPAKWRLNSEGNGGSALEFLGPGGYNPPVRSPMVIGLLSDRQFGDFILEADMLQTGKEYGHRDMCIFFGFQDPSHFYYVHMATRADPHAHNIFLVNGKPRVAIARKTTKGINWGNNIWHRVRLVRKITDGTIEVFYDDMTTPLMYARDKSFGKGYIGFGTFDDSGKIDNVKIFSADVSMKTAGFFKKK